MTRNNSLYLCMFSKDLGFHFFLNNFLESFFFPSFLFLFDSLFIFLQFIEKVFCFYTKFVGKISHLSKKFPWQNQQSSASPASENFFSFLLISKRLKGCFFFCRCRLSLNVLIKAFCRFYLYFFLSYLFFLFLKRQVHKF